MEAIEELRERVEPESNPTFGSDEPGKVADIVRSCMRITIPTWSAAASKRTHFFLKKHWAT